VMNKGNVQQRKTGRMMISLLWARGIPLVRSDNEKRRPFRKEKT